MTPSNCRLSVSVNRISIASEEDLLMQQFNHHFPEKVSDEIRKCQEKTCSSRTVSMRQLKRLMDTTV